MQNPSTPGAAPPPLQAPLSYKPHAPMLRAQVEGLATWLIVDTGASDPIFTKSLATHAGVTLQPAEAGTDHAGAPVSTWTSPDALALHLQDRVFHFAQPLIIEGPPVFKESGIGGVLSPQGLDPSAILLLDLRHDQLQLVQAELAELSKTISAQNPDLALLALPRAEATGDGVRLVVVQAALGSASTPIRLLLNSGGSGTEVSPQVLGAGHTPAEPTIGDIGHGMSGAAVQGYLGADQRLVFEQRSLPLTKVLVRDQGPHFDAQLGMSMLRARSSSSAPTPRIQSSGGSSCIKQDQAKPNDRRAPQAPD